MSRPRGRPIEHGCAADGAQTPEYKCWTDVKGRCLNPKHKSFPSYGGRGITVCEQWRNSFTAFLADVGPRPSKIHSIDRFPNNDGNYEPGNCKWSTPTEQANNRRCTALLNAFGETKPISQWARDLGISKSAIRGRLKRGLSPEKSLYGGRLVRDRLWAQKAWVTRRKSQGVTA